MYQRSHGIPMPDGKSGKLAFSLFGDTYLHNFLTIFNLHIVGRKLHSYAYKYFYCEN